MELTPSVDQDLRWIDKPAMSPPGVPQILAVSPRPSMEAGLYAYAARAALVMCGLTPEEWNNGSFEYWFCGAPARRELAVGVSCRVLRLSIYAMTYCSEELDEMSYGGHGGGDCEDFATTIEDSFVYLTSMLDDEQLSNTAHNRYKEFGVLRHVVTFLRHYEVFKGFMQACAPAAGTDGVAYYDASAPHVYHCAPLLINKEYWTPMLRGSPPPRKTPNNLPKTLWPEGTADVRATVHSAVQSANDREAAKFFFHEMSKSSSAAMAFASRAEGTVMGLGKGNAFPHTVISIAQPYPLTFYEFQKVRHGGDQTRYARFNDVAVLSEDLRVAKVLNGTGWGSRARSAFRAYNPAPPPIAPAVPPNTGKHGMRVETAMHHTPHAIPAWFPVEAGNVSRVLEAARRANSSLHNFSLKMAAQPLFLDNGLAIVMLYFEERRTLGAKLSATFR